MNKNAEAEKPGASLASAFFVDPSDGWRRQLPFQESEGKVVTVRWEVDKRKRRRKRK